MIFWTLMGWAFVAMPWLCAKIGMWLAEGPDPEIGRPFYIPPYPNNSPRVSLDESQTTFFPSAGVLTVTDCIVNNQNIPFWTVVE